MDIIDFDISLAKILFLNIIKHSNPNTKSLKHNKNSILHIESTD